MLLRNYVPFLLIAAILSTAIAFAAPNPKAAETPLTAVDVSAYADGDYILTLKGGTATLRPFKLLTPGNPPTPTPNPTPTPTPNTRSDLFKTTVTVVMGDNDRQGTAKMLATLYREEAKIARTGQIPDAPTLKAIMSQTTDLVLNPRPGAAQAWKPVRELLGTQWTILDAKSSPVSAYADLLDDAATGVDASAPAKQISPEMVALILQIIQLIMKLFFPM